jgi:hypothetical protein
VAEEGITLPDESIYERLLCETVSSIELHNLTELLPTEVWAWWNYRKLEEEAEQNRNKTQAEKFFEQQVDRWRLEGGS